VPKIGTREWRKEEMPNHARARLGEVFRILFDVFPVVLIKIASKNGESDDQP
jgi:hypothetical protein